MVQFIRNHITTCEVCLTDPDINEEVEKITELILPDSKIPKAVRLQQEKDSAVDEEEDEEPAHEEEDTDSDEKEDEEEDEYIEDDEGEEDDELDDLD